MSINYDIFSASASKAANKNLDASILAIQMIKEMRDFNYRRFNDMVDGFHKVLDKMDAQNEQIQNLQSQVAGLQKKLYEEEQKNKGIAR